MTHSGSAKHDWLTVKIPVACQKPHKQPFCQLGYENVNVKFSRTRADEQDCL